MPYLGYFQPNKCFIPYHVTVCISTVFACHQPTSWIFVCDMVTVSQISDISQIAQHRILFFSHIPWKCHFPCLIPMFSGFHLLLVLNCKLGSYLASQKSCWLISWSGTESNNVSQWIEEHETTSGWSLLHKETKRKICWIPKHSYLLFLGPGFQRTGNLIYFKAIACQHGCWLCFVVPHTFQTQTGFRFFWYYASRIFLLWFAVLCSCPEQDPGLALYKTN